MTAFPSTLPLPTTDGYGRKPVDATVRTEMETGTARVRRRTSAPPTFYSVSFVFSDAQMTVFRSFFDNDLANGAAWFDIGLADAKGGVNVRSARFKGPYEDKLLAGSLIWSVTGVLEVKYA